MQLGTIDKIYLEYEKPFWDANLESMNFLWRKEEIKAMRADPVNGDWLSGLHGFSLANPLQPNIICGWISGDAARAMEQKSDADVKAGAEKCIRQFFKQQDIPDAKAMIRYYSLKMLSKLTLLIYLPMHSVWIDQNGIRILISAAVGQAIH